MSLSTIFWCDDIRPVVDCAVEGREEPLVDGRRLSFQTKGDGGLNPRSVCGCSGVGIATVLRFEGVVGAMDCLLDNPWAEEGLGGTDIDSGREGDSPNI